MITLISNAFEVIFFEMLVSEWMHDWENPKAGEPIKEVYSKYGAMIGFDRIIF